MISEHKGIINAESAYFTVRDFFLLEINQHGFFVYIFGGVFLSVKKRLSMRKSNPARCVSSMQKANSSVF